jgi:hypothetical protein
MLSLVPAEMLCQSRLLLQLLAAHFTLKLALDLVTRHMLLEQVARPKSGSTYSAAVPVNGAALKFQVPNRGQN